MSGYLQGMPLSVNGLVHIPGFGDYQMSRIEECKDPFPLRQEKIKSGQDIEMDEDTKVVAVADPNTQVSFIFYVFKFHKILATTFYIALKKNFSLQILLK